MRQSTDNSQDGNFLFAPIDRGTMCHKCEDIRGKTKGSRKNVNRATEEWYEQQTSEWTDLMPVCSQTRTVMEDFLEPLRTTGPAYSPFQQLQVTAATGF